MLLDLAKQYADIVQGIEVEKFRIVGDSYELRATFLLKDGSRLFVKDYLFLDGTRKYADHWQDRPGRLINRWDNVPHWNELQSYPHHRHVGAADVVESSPTLPDQAADAYPSPRLSAQKRIRLSGDPINRPNRRDSLARLASPANATNATDAIDAMDAMTQ